MTNSNAILLRDGYTKNGVVYTPYDFAKYVSYKTVDYYVEDSLDKEDQKPIKIIDPACGEGVLLETLYLELIEKQKENKQIEIHGIDIDKKAIKKSKHRILDRLNLNEEKLNLITGNALTLFDNSTTNNQFDILIANPPWGADFSDYEDKLNKNNFKTLGNQVDSFELFIELALRIIRKRGYFSFIIPDSILNYEKSRLREILLKNTEIKFISRMGEKIFPKVNRGSVVLICKKSQPTKTSKVDCFRLNKTQRRKILKNKLTFLEAEKREKHQVKQHRFLRNKEFIFDIDLKNSEFDIVQKIRGTKHVLGKYLKNSRGVELSKTGKVCRCPFCNRWMPYPTTKSKECNNCKKTFELKNSASDCIISENRKNNSVPLICGEDIKRYEIKPSRWLKKGYNGIEYKKRGVYKGKKMLVRKTGVGISASIDYSDSYTTQVVYIFKLKENAPADITLEFILALINSRAYYFYLTKIFGENEWKSYPYVTQNQILSLPFPRMNKKQRQTARKISELVETNLCKNCKIPDKVDAEIEYLISTIFKLNKNDYETIFKTINESQNLQPIKILKNIDENDIFKNRE